MMNLREALHIILREESLADNVYTVRDRAVGEDPHYEGNSWDLPRVKRFSEAVRVLDAELRRLGEGR